MARPRLELDEDQIEKLAMINCSLAEIASVMRCSVDTLERYSEVIKRGRENGKSSLKKKQFEVAMKGNVTMLIWLGKIVLGQKEEKIVDVRASPEAIPQLFQALSDKYAKDQIKP
jgi:hypothetical protein